MLFYPTSAISSLSGPNILLSTLLSDTFSLRFYSVLIIITAFIAEYISPLSNIYDGMKAVP
jgi:hypothetical protein